MEQFKGNDLVHELGNMAYEMDPSKHGLALILNFNLFHPKLEISERVGSDKDVLGLVETFSMLGFQIDEWKDYQKDHKRLTNKLLQVSERKDYNCLVVVVMTHGNVDGYLMAYDTYFHVDDIWKPFVNSSKGIPKLFFYQACRGDGYSPAIQSDAVKKKDYIRNEEFSIPIPPNMMIAYATWPGNVSGRYEGIGSIFIHELCMALKRDKGKNHFLRVMTNVLKAVATNYELGEEENGDVSKQMPVFIYNFNKFLYLKPKACSKEEHS